LIVPCFEFPNVCPAFARGMLQAECHLYIMDSSLPHGWKKAAAGRWPVRWGWAGGFMAGMFRKFWRQRRAGDL